MGKSSKRSTPTVAQVIRGLRRNSLPAHVATTVTRRELAVLRAGKLSYDLKKAVSRVRSALQGVRRAQRPSSVNGTGMVISTGFELASPGTMRKTSLKTLRNELNERAARLKLALEAMPMKTSISQGKPLTGRKAQHRGASPAVMLDLVPLNMSLNSFAARLRTGTPPVFGFVENGRFRLDLKAINPSQDEPLFRAIYKAFGL